MVAYKLFQNCGHLHTRTHDMNQKIVDLRHDAAHLHHHWSECVGAGRAAECLRADWQQQLSLAQQSCGYKRIRFHGLFHDDMFLLHRMPDGSIWCLIGNTLTQYSTVF